MPDFLSCHAFILTLKAFFLLLAPYDSCKLLIASNDRPVSSAMISNFVPRASKFFATCSIPYSMPCSKPSVLIALNSAS